MTAFWVGSSWHNVSHTGAGSVMKGKERQIANAHPTWATPGNPVGPRGVSPHRGSQRARVVVVVVVVVVLVVVVLVLVVEVSDSAPAEWSTCEAEWLHPALHTADTASGPAELQ